jgi:hypothetical protein
MSNIVERLHAIASQQAGTFSDANAAVLREAAAEIERLREALRACIDLIEAAQQDGYERGVDDIELVADGSYRLSDARAALAGKEE